MEGGVQFKERSGGATPKLAEVERVRMFFPETWIWSEHDAR